MEWRKLIPFQWQHPNTLEILLGLHNQQLRYRQHTVPNCSRPHIPIAARNAGIQVLSNEKPLKFHAVTCVISKLTFRQLRFDFVNSRSVAWVETSLQVRWKCCIWYSTDDLQNVLVQANLPGVDVIAQPELKVSHVTCGQLDSNGNG